MISTFSLEKIFRLRATISRLTCSINSCTLANPHTHSFTNTYTYVHNSLVHITHIHVHTSAMAASTKIHTHYCTRRQLKNTRIAHTQYTYKTKHTNTDMYTQKKQRTNTYLRTKHTHTHDCWTKCWRNIVSKRLRWLIMVRNSFIWTEKIVVDRWGYKIQSY